MTKFIELKTNTGSDFLIDFESGWEVHGRTDDNGNPSSASWGNFVQCRNLCCGLTYDEVKDKLQKAGMLNIDDATHVLQNIDNSNDSLKEINQKAEIRRLCSLLESSC